MSVYEVGDSVSGILVAVGAWGVVSNRRSVIVVLMSVELVLLGVNLALVTKAMELDDVMGLVFAVVVMTVGAGETAVGLAVVVGYYRVASTLEVENSAIMAG